MIDSAKRQAVADPSRLLSGDFSDSRLSLSQHAGCAAWKHAIKNTFTTFSL